MKQMSTQRFVERHGITIQSKPIDANPHMPDSRDMHHYRVTLRNGKRSMSLPFSMGYAYENPPTAEQVLDCLASDSADVQGASFEEWVRDMGIDLDSRRGLRTFEACRRNADHLERLLGERDYGILLYKVARS